MTASTAGPGDRRRGRPPGGGRSRAALLAAARVEFAERGFDGATVRAIAGRAGVDPAMVSHAFGGKQRLFAAVMDLPVDVGDAVARVLDGPRDRAGERLVRMFLDVWDAHPQQLTGLVRSIATTEQAATAMREFLGHAVLEPLVAQLDVDHQRLRVELCATQMVGLAIGRYVLRLPTVGRADAASLVATIGPTVQRYLTGRLTAVPR